MLKLSHAKLVWVFLSAASLLTAAPVDSGTGDVKTYAHEIEESIRLSLATAEAAVDMSVNALANAMALVGEAQKDLLLALKSESREQVEKKRRHLGACVDAQDDALDLGMRVDLDRRHCRAKADLGMAMIEQAFKAQDGKAVKSFLRKAEKISKSAHKYASKASIVAEKTKERWLLPQILPAEKPQAE